MSAHKDDFKKEVVRWQYNIHIFYILLKWKKLLCVIQDESLTFALAAAKNFLWSNDESGKEMKD